MSVQEFNFIHRKMSSFQKKLFTIAFCLPLALFAQTTLYVSPNGNDANGGSAAKPLATIGRAVAEARKVSGNVVINILEGTYYMSHPIVFTPKDSRTGDETLILTSFEKQMVTISGGIQLNLKWEPYKNGIWKAVVVQELVFDELFVNGQLQRMARYPNFDPTARFLGGTAADAISKERAVLWKSPEGGYVHALHVSEWGDFHYAITGKNDKGEPTLEGGWQNNRRYGMHQKYRFVENIFEELDTVNEWFYDKSSKTLYYFPPEGIDIETATFETPQIAHLFEFKGSETNPVKNISIEGVTLTQTLRTFMDNKEPLL